MANSKYEYVRLFEKNDALLPNCPIVVRIDGHSFHRFSVSHDFAKPNDKRALELMNHAAKAVMRMFPDMTLAYGTSDEFSFLLRPGYGSFERREAKLVSTVVSCFTASYLFSWPDFFTDKALLYPPTFDGRAVLYPSPKNVRDYFSWRQVDAHINNLYNTCFWTLQLKRTLDGQGELLTARQAEERLRGTISSQKHELLYSSYGINYHHEDEMFKKGSILLYPNAPDSVDGQQQVTSKTAVKKEERRRKKEGVVVLHVDLIQDSFWQTYPDILDL